MTGSGTPCDRVRHLMRRVIDHEVVAIVERPIGTAYRTAAITIILVINIWQVLR